MNTAPPEGKYQQHPVIDLPDRQWPSKTMSKAPKICEVGLRDGNQSLENPMTPDQKLLYFQTLVEMGFKQIEVGFPSASDEDFTFCRRLIEEAHLPDDVSIQVLVQCRESLIRRTCDAIKGANNAIIHFYNSTDPTQRELTFGKSPDEIRQLAVNGAKLVKRFTKDFAGDMNLQLEYSPESFSDTELDYAIQVCGSVMEVVEPTEDQPMILNLPQTVQRYMPNNEADRIEYFIRNLTGRSGAEISLHAHNDCGTGVAATELALLAGADRVEGVLFGNGERAGNANLTTLLGNMYSRGIDPTIDLSQLDKVREVYESTTGMKVPDREPYAGRLVFTAFSGSHQDSIGKGMTAMAKDPSDPRWRVHYLHVDPTELGRSYEPVRVNGQSGKGGSAYVLKEKYGIDVPKFMQSFVYQVIQQEADKTQKEVSFDRIYALFKESFIENNGYTLGDFNIVSHEGREVFTGSIECRGNESILDLEGEGEGPIEAFVNALEQQGLHNFMIQDFEQSIDQQESGSDAHSYGFMQLEFEDGKVVCGCGMSKSTNRANFEAILSAMHQHEISEQSSTK